MAPLRQRFIEEAGAAHPAAAKVARAEGTSSAEAERAGKLAAIVLLEETGLFAGAVKWRRRQLEVTHSEPPASNRVGAWTTRSPAGIVGPGSFVLGGAARLREMGYAPAAESAEGDVPVARPDAHRTPPRSAPEPVPDGPPVPDGGAADGGRTGNPRQRPRRDGRAPAGLVQGAGGAVPRTTSADTIATMQSAVLSGSALWIGYVNADGAASRRVIAPVRVEGGFVTAYDRTADEVRTYPLHRITGVAELAEG